MKKLHLMSVEEAALYLKMKVSRLRYEVFKKSIPFYKIGRSVRFSEADLIAWLESKKCGASDESR